LKSVLVDFSSDGECTEHTWEYDTCTAYESTGTYDPNLYYATAVNCVYDPENALTDPDFCIEVGLSWFRCCDAYTTELTKM